MRPFFNQFTRPNLFNPYGLGSHNIGEGIGRLGRTLLFPRVHCKGEGGPPSAPSAPAAGVSTAPAQAAAGKVIQSALFIERARLFSLLDPTNKDLTQQTRILEGYAHGQYPIFDNVLAGNTFQTLISHNSPLNQSGLAEKALDRLGGLNLRNREINPADAYMQMKSIERILNETLYNRLLMFLENGTLATQRGLLLFFYQYALITKGEENVKINVPPELKTALDNAKKTMAAEWAQENERLKAMGQAPATQTDFARLIYDEGKLSLANIMAKPGEAGREMRTIDLETVLDAFRNEKSSDLIRSALRHALASIFAGQEKDMFLQITTSLEANQLEQLPLTLKIARILFQTLNSPEKKSRLYSLIFNFYRDNPNSPLKEEILDTLVTFKYDAFVHPSRKYAEDMIQQELDPNSQTPLRKAAGSKAAEPIVLPKNRDLMLYVEKICKELGGELVSAICTLVKEKNMPKSLRATNGKAVESTDIYNKSQDELSQRIRALSQTAQRVFWAAADTSDPDKLPNEVSMIGNLDAFIELIQFMIKEFKFDPSLPGKVMLSKAGAGSRSGLLGLAEAIDKGTIRLGRTAFETISTFAAVIVLSQLPDHGKGWIVFTGCDQMLIPYGGDNLTIGRHKVVDYEKNTGTKLPGLIITTVRAEVEGSTNADDYKYLCGLGNVIITSKDLRTDVDEKSKTPEGLRLAFVEKPKTVELLREQLRKATLFSVLGKENNWGSNLKNFLKGKNLGGVPVEDLFLACAQDLNVTLTYSGSLRDYFLEVARGEKTLGNPKLNALAKGFMYTYINTFVMSARVEIAKMLTEVYEMPTETDSSSILRKIFTQDPYFDWSQLLMEAMVIGKDEHRYKPAAKIQGEWENLRKCSQRYARILSEIDADFATSLNLPANFDLPENMPTSISPELNQKIEALVCLRAWEIRKRKTEGWQKVELNDWMRLWWAARKIEHSANGLGVAVADYFSDTGTVVEVFKVYFQIFFDENRADPYLNKDYAEIQRFSQGLSTTPIQGQNRFVNFEKGIKFGGESLNEEQLSRLNTSTDPITINGVTIQNPRFTYIGEGTELAQGTTVEPWSILLQAKLGQSTHIPSYCIINGANIPKAQVVFPEQELPKIKGKNEQERIARPDEIKPGHMRIIYDQTYEGEKTLVIEPSTLHGSIELMDSLRAQALQDINDAKIKGQVPGVGIGFDHLASAVQAFPRRLPRAIDGGKK